ncbi:WecB/TagA/CpsF family glycosyltransferase [Paraurantiacibacter namhicola]|uniref:Putative N-acetylmannosaminyltransferase n=1 Tax=Paraurantiacibacter namhicola TaxID=645517 RepID=A0A1C7D724_9SPHN|nr:WecB/TagA/CpsF family glycosyltransferase [Paraurantiacibacter namhicola]ANU07152.1 Putative N-acetylmannosaminyltransferase [Paraurantiacibacter namhicola]
MQQAASRITFFGTPVDLLDREQTLARAQQAMDSGQPLRHTALNVAKLIKLEGDELLAEDVRGSDLVGIDGMGIVLGLKLFGVDKAERVAGVDLFLDVLALCARTGRRPYILGARQDVLERAMAEAMQRNPGLEFAGARNGYYGPDDVPQIVADIRVSGADCLFVAMPTPRKERFLNAHARDLGVPFIMGVGGSVDVLAGHVSRAPRWMQRNGLEWFHRMVKEPRKMFWRYASTNAAYAWLLLKTKLSGRNPLERY